MGNRCSEVSLIRQIRIHMKGKTDMWIFFFKIQFVGLSVSYHIGEGGSIAVKAYNWRSFFVKILLRFFIWNVTAFYYFLKLFFQVFSGNLCFYQLTEGGMIGASDDLTIFIDYVCTFEPDPDYINSRIF